jgi:SAM-dependent methyltransferase
MHPQAYAYGKRTLALLPAPQRVADLGGRNVNGSAQPLLPADVCYTVVDLRDGPNVDAIADAAVWGEANAYDLVICTEVLEHAPAAAAICANAHRILKPGGAFLVTTATTGRREHSAEDGGDLRAGEFYRNVRPEDLRAWLDPFRRIEIEIERFAHDLYALAVK